MVQLTLPEFAEKMDQIMPVIMREFARRQVKEIYEGKITMPQFLVLDFLHKNGEISMKPLSVSMKVSTAAMTGLVERLVRDGYAVRGYDPQDRRIVKVDLTSKGKELVRKVHLQRRQMVINVFDKINEADRGDYLRVVERIRDVLIKDSRD